jgi:hypothetical protein
MLEPNNYQEDTHYKATANTDPPDQTTVLSLQVTWCQMWDRGLAVELKWQLENLLSNMKAAMNAGQK